MQIYYENVILNLHLNFKNYKKNFLWFFLKNADFHILQNVEARLDTK